MSPDAGVRILFSGELLLCIQLIVAQQWIGNAIEIYGSVGKDHGTFTVQLDSDEPRILNGTSTEYHLPSVHIVSHAPKITLTDLPTSNPEVRCWRLVIRTSYPLDK